MRRLVHRMQLGQDRLEELIAFLKKQQALIPADSEERWTIDYMLVGHLVLLDHQNTGLAYLRKVLEDDKAAVFKPGNLQNWAEAVTKDRLQKSSERQQAHCEE